MKNWFKNVTNWFKNLPRLVKIYYRRYKEIIIATIITTISIIVIVPLVWWTVVNRPSVSSELAEKKNSSAVPTPAPLPTPAVTSLTVTQFVTVITTQVVVLHQTSTVPAKAISVDNVVKSTTASNSPSPTLFTFSPNMHQTVNVNGKDVSARKKDNEVADTDVTGANVNTIDVTVGGSSSSESQQILTNEPSVVIIEPKGHVRMVHRDGRRILFGKMNVPKLKQSHYRTADGVLIWELYNPWDVTAEFHLSWINKPNN